MRLSSARVFTSKTFTVKHVEWRAQQSTQQIKITLYLWILSYPTKNKHYNLELHIKFSSIFSGQLRTNHTKPGTYNSQKLELPLQVLVMKKNVQCHSPEHLVIKLLRDENGNSSRSLFVILAGNNAGLFANASQTTSFFSALPTLEKANFGFCKAPAHKNIFIRCC